MLCRTFAYGSKVRAQAGTDCFDIHPDQRLKRCEGLFDSEAQVTDPVAFLERLRHKFQYRAGRARALLARLSADLSDWLGWDVGGSLGRECAFEARWQATRASLRRPAIVALNMARHIFDASTRLDDPGPLQQPGVVLLDRPDVWFPKVQFFVALSPSGRGRFPAQLLEQCLSIQRADWNHCVDVFCRQKVGFWMSETQGQCGSPIDCQFHRLGEFAIKEAKNLFWIAYGNRHGRNHSV